MFFKRVKGLERLGYQLHTSTSRLIVG